MATSPPDTETITIHTSSLAHLQDGTLASICLAELMRVLPPKAEGDEKKSPQDKQTQT